MTPSVIGANGANGANGNRFAPTFAPKKSQADLGFFQLWGNGAINKKKYNSYTKTFLHTFQWSHTSDNGRSLKCVCKTFSYTVAKTLAPLPRLPQTFGQHRPTGHNHPDLRSRRTGFFLRSRVVTARGEVSHVYQSKTTAP